MSAIRAVRSAEGRFVQLANSGGQDPRLSLEARGIIYFVLSLPPDKHFTAEWLETQVPNGRRVVRSALRELESYGYFSRTRKSAGRGKWVWDQVISDAPIDGAAPMQFPAERQPLSPAAKELAQESAARAREARRASSSSSSPVSDELTCGNIASSQVSSSDKGSSDEKLTDKNLRREHLNDEKDHGHPDVASRRGRASGAAAKLTDPKIIEQTRLAIVEVYGADEDEWISDEQILTLWEWKRPQDGRRVTSVRAYMTKIFSDSPGVDTLLAGLCGDYDGEDDELPAAAPPSSVPSVEAWNEDILKAVRNSLKDRTGVDVADEWAARVAHQILSERPSRGTRIPHPTAYVKSAIYMEPNPANFLPTPMPPRIGVAA